jgi:hypothetical protein
MTGTPGSHGRNWQPAQNIDDYLRNVREGLEEYSDRRAAKLLGYSRARLYRAKLMAEIPDDLFDLLLAHGVLSTKELANVAKGIRGDTPDCEHERCPHCGGPLRVRPPWRKKTAAIVNAWLEERSPSS